MRSVRGTFAWTTSPYLLRRFRARPRRGADRKLTAAPEPTGTQALVAKGSRLVADGRVAFEDFDFEAKESPELTALAGALGPLLLDPEDAALLRAAGCASCTTT